jgi:hypothetical protein
MFYYGQKTDKYTNKIVIVKIIANAQKDGKKKAKVHQVPHPLTN